MTVSLFSENIALFLSLFVLHSFRELKYKDTHTVSSHKCTSTYRGTTNNNFQLFLNSSLTLLALKLLLSLWTCLLLLPSRIQAPEQPCTGCPEDHHAEALLISGLTEDAVFHYISQFEHKFPLHVIVGTPSNLMHLAHLIYGLLELLKAISKL